jgi:hypothetical protein
MEPMPVPLCRSHVVVPLRLKVTSAHGREGDTDEMDEWEAALNRMSWGSLAAHPA